MNAYSFLSAVAFASYLGLAATALVLGPRARTNRVFAALCGTMAVWAFLFALGPAVPTREAWFDWYRASAPAWLLVPALSLHLCLAVTGRRLGLLLAAAVYGPAVLLAAVGAALDLGVDLDFVRTDLGWVTDRARVPLVARAFFGYSAAAHVTGLAVVWRWGRRSAQRREGCQARLLVASGAATLAAGYTLSLVVPSTGGQLPCTAHLVGLIWAGGALVAIVRHRFMALTPAFAARQIIDGIGDALLLTDAEGRVVDANRRAIEALGRERHELVGRPWEELTGEPAAARAAFAAVRSAAGPTAALETFLMGGGGTRRPVAVTGAPVPNAAGDVVGVTLVARDLRPEQALSAEVWRRRRAEEELEAEQEDARVLIASVGEAIVSTDAAGYVTRLNPPAAALAGCDGAAAVGRPFHDVFPLTGESAGQPGDDLVARAIAANRTIVGAVTRLPATPQRPAERVVEWSAAPLHEPTSETVRGCVLVGRDVTDRRRVEQELQRVARLESIGTLAGGIAHDFNNLLVGVLGSLTLARRELDHPGGTVANRLGVAERSAERAAGLARQLLTFARGGAPLRHPLELPALLAEWAGFALSGSPVRLELRLAPDLRPVLADEGQLHQVVQNLVLNARQAMPAGGTLALTAENVAHGACAALRPQPLGYVQLTFADEGCGIPADALPRIFDPFFTTREGGTGLGLATTFSIVQRHEGHVAVESAPGRGAVFRVWLPAATCVPARPAERGASVRGGGRVLVMDDEALVLEVAVAMLSRLGYDATAVRDGDAALAAVDAASVRGEPFDLALLDLTVAEGLGGLETARRLRVAHPGLRLVVSSGYASGSVLADFRAHGFASVLPKPYRPEDLAAALAEALAAAPSVA
jgi:PAS domain S-box-containing protein